MIISACSIVLTTHRIDLPENPNVFELVNNLLHNNLCNIDYFGSLLDNQADFIDEAMSEKMTSTTFITIHFDINQEIELDDYCSEEEINGLFLKVMMEYEINEIRSDEKDITIYVNI